MNPQSSRSSIALGPVPTAPKPAPNPITTNMPQFGSAPGLTNSDGVPTLPPVSPATTQPLTPAPTPAPATAPASSAMPQYMNAANTNMIPVVDKPLDINKVPDTPAEQFNPFSSTTGSAPKPPKKSSGNTLNLLLGLLTILFSVVAVIFFILWQGVEPKTVVMPNTPSENEQPDDPENPSEEQPAGQIQRLSCRGSSELTEEDLAAGIVSNSSVYDVYYPGDVPTEVHISATSEYNSPEAAANVYAEASNETMAVISGIYAAIGLELGSENFILDNNHLSMNLTVPVEKITNPDTDAVARQMLATLAGLPTGYAEDGITPVFSTNLDAVRANYESAGLACEIIAE